MEILVAGTTEQFDETKRKFGSGNNYQLAADRHLVPSQIDIVFDFLNGGANNVSVYKGYSNVLFLNSVFTTLNALHLEDFSCSIFGFCGLPTFVDRPILEVTLAKQQSNEFLLSTCGKLGTDYRVVADKVGMVTPRVICMIINEAYYTEEEGTATREDIDKAMKLGTNYPFGPFEWCERIGKENVCGLLRNVYEATRDSRYVICPSLLAQSRLQ
jgi:3-hydroxybutyryl-CoA dehydrogenase